jgi:hypothetical protein
MRQLPTSFVFRVIPENALIRRFLKTKSMVVYVEKQWGVLKSFLLSKRTKATNLIS